ncbi:hypothetical protein COCMIDRAFT_36187 [Bipolaris oryzae ATCC 44560]|uniref:Uncharacterized protein n=1 Tax=Bipolaris oryzae ATCC 44560 TaxID=930090 RepID=W6Z7X3_COCMI|nr:uncharacterized protein COCMIDRAFT_36187 [Bipolaris oryzae ATCC 44560]EUC46100.1 hypothetical protein COCMIDRAFT_36187 [Bipolaris oryzae ATCC 44560]
MHPKKPPALTTRGLDTSAARESVADSIWLGKNFRVVALREKDHNEVEQSRASLKVAGYSLDTQTYTDPTHLGLGIQSTLYAATNSKQS